jgi:predicted Zn finger-like uncharacterized protein
MDIRCERCATEYELEDSRVTAAGVTIKCVTCGHVFKVIKAAAPAPDACSLRLYRGGTTVPASCPDPGTLQQWIIEQRVLRDDEISFNGTSWQRLGDIPELVPFFALLSMPPPLASRAPTGAGAFAPPPIVAPPPAVPLAAAPANPFYPAPAATPLASSPVGAAAASALNMAPAPMPPPGPVPAWDAITPTPTIKPAWQSAVQSAIGVPAPFTNGSAASPHTNGPSASPAVTNGPTSPAGTMRFEVGGPGTAIDASAATIQIAVTPDMFAPKPAAPPATVPTPWPALSETHTDGIVSKPTPAAAATVAMQSPVSAPSKPRTYVPPRTTSTSPAVRKAPVSIPRKPPADHDPEISAFVRRSRFRAIAIVAGIVLVAVAGVVVWVVNPGLFGGEAGPSPHLKEAYEQGRKLYLTDTVIQFQQAEKAFKAASKDRGAFPEANAALAELYTAWAEHLMDRYNALNAEMKAKTEAGNTEEAKGLARQINVASAEVKKKLDAANEEVNGLKEMQLSPLAADRAALDYYRLAGDTQHATIAADSLKTQTDPETVAHVAAWQAMDPAQAASAEAALKDSIQKMPSFVRARWWLAQLHIRQGNLPAAAADMEDILKVAPSHEWANDFLARQKMQPTVASAPAPTPAPGKEAVKEAPKAAAPAETHEKAPPPAEKEASKSSRKEAEEDTASSSGPLDVDKAIDQAGRFLEKGKPSRALDLYDRVLMAKPTLTDALYGKGVALYNMGRTEDAINAFKKTLEVNHRFGDAMIGIAEAYKKLNDRKSAGKFYQQYLDMYPTGPQATAARANVKALQ